MLDAYSPRRGVSLLPLLLVLLAASGCAPGLRQVQPIVPRPTSSTTLENEQGDPEKSRRILLAASGGRPSPKPPPLPPRPPSRGNQRGQQNEPVRPGHVPGRRLAGPPDAPYWETVFEIPWGGGPLQGPRTAPPQRAPVETSGSIPAQRSPVQQPGQPPSSPAAQSPQSASNATTGTRQQNRIPDRGRTRHRSNEPFGNDLKEVWL